MPAGEKSSLRRMVHAPAERGRPLPVHRAFRQAIGQVAHGDFRLHAVINGIEDSQTDIETVLSELPETGLVFGLIGPRGGPGLAIVSDPLLAALIEAQTAGSLSGAAQGERSPTPTDAAIVEPFVANVLARLGDTMAGVEGEEWACGHVPGPPAFDRRRLALDIPDIAYRRLRAVMDIAGTGTEADLCIVLPRDPAQAATGDVGKRATNALNNWRRQLEASVLSSRAQLTAVLHRAALPVAKVRALNAGDVVPLPADAENSIVVEGPDGSAAATGRIGMVNGMKAVRIRAIGAMARDAHGNEDLDATAQAGPAPEETFFADAEEKNPGPAMRSTAPALEPPVTMAVPPAQVSDLSEPGGFSDDHADLPELDIAN